MISDVSATRTDEDDPRGSSSLKGLSSDDRLLLWSGATLLLDTTGLYAKDVSEFVMEKLSGLPKDPEMVAALEKHAEADAREVLITLRAGMDPSAHETPVEALVHARYLRQRGVGLSTLIDVYKYGFAEFRELVGLELDNAAHDEAQAQRLKRVIDAYSFPFVSTTLQRLAYEFESTEGWEPSASDPVLSDSECLSRARRLRERQISQGRWVAASPEGAGAKAAAEQALDDFAEAMEAIIRVDGVSQRLARAAGSVTITLADQTDLSLGLLLDRTPVEIVEGTAETDGRIWIPSVDLERLWSPDFYLPMAIAKGRVAIEGQVRKFLRVIPMLRAIHADGELLPANTELSDEENA